MKTQRIFTRNACGSSGRPRRISLFFPSQSHRQIVLYPAGQPSANCARFSRKYAQFKSRREITWVAKGFPARVFLFWRWTGSRKRDRPTCEGIGEEPRKKRKKTARSFPFLVRREEKMALRLQISLAHESPCYACWSSRRKIYSHEFMSKAPIASRFHKEHAR